MKVYSASGEFVLAIGESGAPEGRPVRSASHDQPRWPDDRFRESSVGCRERFPAQTRERLDARRQVRPRFLWPRRVWRRRPTRSRGQNAILLSRHGVSSSTGKKARINPPGILYRPGPGELSEAAGYLGRPASPEQPHYFKGRRYFSNELQLNPTAGTGRRALDCEVTALPGRWRRWAAPIVGISSRPMLSSHAGPKA